MPNYVTFHNLTVVPASPSLSFEVLDYHHNPVANLISPKKLPSRKIEFLGDSITAGFCNECTRPKSDDVSDHNEAFGYESEFRF